jgi:hypothetical protein
LYKLGYIEYDSIAKDVLEAYISILDKSGNKELKDKLISYFEKKG